MEPLFLGGVGAIKKMGFTSPVDGLSIKAIINSEPVQLENFAGNFRKFVYNFQPFVFSEKVQPLKPILALLI